jgi:hypothetical protein
LHSTLKILILRVCYRKQALFIEFAYSLTVLIPCNMYIDTECVKCMPINCLFPFHSKRIQAFTMFFFCIVLFLSLELHSSMIE